MLGPLFEKELLTLARQRRMFGLRVVAAGLMLLALLWHYSAAVTWLHMVSSHPAGRWVTMANGTRFWAPDNPFAVQWTANRAGLRTPVANPLYLDGAANSTQLMAHALKTTGLRVASWWAFGGAALVLALAPMLLAGTIAGERRNRTLETLFATHLSSREILLGKAAGRMLPVAAALAATVPPLAFATYFGGFTAEHIGWTAALLAALAWALAGVALEASARSAGTMAALFRTYFLIGLAAIVFYASARFPGLFPLWLAAALAGVEPFQVLQVLYFGGGPSGAAIGLPLALYGLIGAVGMLSAGRRLRTEVEERRAWLWRAVAGTFHDFVAGLRGALEAVQGPLWRLQLASERRVVRKLAALADRHPLAYRQRVANLYDPQRWVGLLQWLPAVVAVTLMFGIAFFGMLGSFGSFEDAVHWTFGSATWLQPLVAVALAAGAWAHERQALSWDTLRLASLPARAHVGAAFFGVFRTMRPGLVMLAAGLPLALTQHSSDAAALAGGAALLAQLAMLVVGGLLASAVSERVGPALGRAFGAWGLAFALGMLAPAVAAASWAHAAAAASAAAGLALLFRARGHGVAWGMPLLFVAATLLAADTRLGRSVAWSPYSRAAAPGGPLAWRAFPQPYWMGDVDSSLVAAVVAIAVAAVGVLALLRRFDRFATAEPRRRPAA